MKKAFLLLLLASTVGGYFISQEIDSVALKYKGYDEILVNITEVEYRNQTYYWVDYTKDLRYSGSILIGGDGSPVTDKEVLIPFGVAAVLHTSYPANSTRMWFEFSRNYARIAPELPANLSVDCLEISRLLNQSGTHLSDSIASFSPDDAEGYFETEDLVIRKMNESLGKMEGLSLREASSAYVEEYRQSLLAISAELSLNKKALLQAGTYLAETARDKVVGEVKRPETESNMLSLVAGLIILIIGVLAAKKLRH